MLAAAAVAGCGTAPAPRPQPARIPLPDDAKAISADASAYRRPLGAAFTTAHASDPAYVERWLRSFTSVTPENAMKWEVVEPQRGERELGEADAIVDTARDLGKRVRGHPLVWDQQLPAWLSEPGTDVEQAMREHVRTLVSRYKGRVAQWDVVNEPLEDDGTLTQSVFAKAMGERFIDVAFEEAHRADPGAQLFLNELAAERPSPKLRALVALVQRLKDRGVPIDGVGLQNHTTSADPPTAGDLRRTMDRFAALGLKTEITEMDVTVKPGAPLDPQAAAYAGAAAACAQTPTCTGLTVWGVTDRWSWLGADQRPLPYAADGSPKPAAAALDGALRTR